MKLIKIHSRILTLGVVVVVAGSVCRRGAWHGPWTTLTLLCLCQLSKPSFDAVLTSHPQPAIFDFSTTLTGHIVLPAGSARLASTGPGSACDSPSNRLVVPPVITTRRRTHSHPNTGLHFTWRAVSAAAERPAPWYSDDALFCGRQQRQLDTLTRRCTPVAEHTPGPRQSDAWKGTRNEAAEWRQCNDERQSAQRRTTE